MIAFVELWIAFSYPGDPWIPSELALLGVSLAMVGPDTWSIDARLFDTQYASAFRNWNQALVKGEIDGATCKRFLPRISPSEKRPAQGTQTARGVVGLNGSSNS